MCGCKRRSNVKFIWTAPDDSGTIEYDSEIQAKAKVIRSGGSYTRKDG